MEKACFRAIRCFGCPRLQENTGWVISLLIGFEIYLCARGLPRGGLKHLPTPWPQRLPPTQAGHQAAVGKHLGHGYPTEPAEREAAAGPGPQATGARRAPLYG